MTTLRPLRLSEEIKMADNIKFNRKDAEFAEKAKGANFDFRFPLSLYRDEGLKMDKLINTLCPLRLCGEVKNG